MYKLLLVVAVGLVLTGCERKLDLSNSLDKSAYNICKYIGGMKIYYDASFFNHHYACLKNSGDVVKIDIRQVRINAVAVDIEK